MRSHIFIYCMTRSFKILCYSCCNVIFIIPNDFVPFCLWCKSSKEKKNKSQKLPGAFTFKNDALSVFAAQMSRKYTMDKQATHAAFRDSWKRWNLLAWTSGETCAHTQLYAAWCLFTVYFSMESWSLCCWNDKSFWLRVRAFRTHYVYVCVCFVYFFLLFSRAIFCFLWSYIVSRFCWFAAVNTVSSSVLLSFPHSQSLSTLCGSRILK